MWVRRYTNTTISMGSVHMLHTLKWHQQNQQARQLSLSCALVIKQQYNRDRTVANGFRSLIERWIALLLARLMMKPSL